MENHWKVKRPRLLISVIGGAKFLKLDKSLKENLKNALMKAAENNGNKNHCYHRGLFSNFEVHFIKEGISVVFSQLQNFMIFTIRYIIFMRNYEQFLSYIVIQKFGSSLEVLQWA